MLSKSWVSATGSPVSWLSRMLRPRARQRRRRQESKRRSTSPNKENAWPELRITRKETLFGDVACVKGSSLRTNPSFVYHTPWVRFAEILKPRIEYGRTIDIAKLPKEQGKDPDTVLQQPLVDHLSRLFKRFFESCPIPAVRSRPSAACSLRVATNTTSTSRRTKAICS